MTKNFEYMTKIVVENDIEIEDIAECAIVANNDLNERWCLIITTELGTTEVFEVGPITDDMTELRKYFSMSYKRLEYSEYKISKIIDKFLNEPARDITQAFEIDKEEAKKYYVNLANYIR